MVLIAKRALMFMTGLAIATSGLFALILLIYHIDTVFKYLFPTLFGLMFLVIFCLAAWDLGAYVFSKLGLVDYDRTKADYFIGKLIE